MPVEREEQIAMSPLRRLDKQSLERADAVRGRLDQSASSRPTSSRGRSTTTTASVPPGNLSGDGSVRSTKHIPTRVRASSPDIATERSFSTARDTPVIMGPDQEGTSDGSL